MTSPIHQILLAEGTVLVPPPDLTGLIGWWDASVFSSLTLTSGTNINSIADQSGGGHTMSKAGSTNFPHYNSVGFNTSYPAMVFTGTDLAALQTTSFPMGTGNTLTAWYVGTLDDVNSTPTGRILSYAKPSAADSDNAGSWFMSTASGSHTAIFMSRNGVSISTTGLTAPQAGHRIITTIDSSGVMTLYVDGVAGTPGTSAGNWVSAGIMGIGVNHNGTEWWSGAVGEAGVATGFSNAVTVAGLDLYLKNKWGL